MNESEIDLRGVVGLIRRQLRIILTCVVLAMAAAALYVTLKTPVYTATTLVLVDPRQKNLLDPESQMSLMPTDNARVESEVEILRSTSTLLGTIAALDLASRPEYGVRIGWIETLATFLGIPVAIPTPSPSDLLQQMVDGLRQQVAVSRRGLTYVISIAADSTDPAEAARLANTVATVYIRQQIDAKVANALSVRDALSNRLARASQTVNETEAGIDAFLARSIDQLAAEGGRADITALRDQLEAIKANAIGSSETIATVSRYVAEENWSAVADQLESDIIRELDRQRTDLAARLAAADGGTARAVDLKAQLDRLDRSLQDQVEQQVDTLRDRAELASEQEARVRDQLRSAVLSANLPNETVVELYRLQQEADISRGQYQGLLKRLSDVEAQADLQMADSRIVSEATPPRAPTAPRGRLILAIALVGSLGLGIGLAFLVENYIGGFTSAEQLEAVAGLPVLAAIPLLSTEARGSRHRRDVADEIVARPLSAYSEAIRRARLGTEVLARAPRATATAHERKALLIMVASAVPGEGKTTFAVSLARAFALSGFRTLLIDCDLRRPAVAATAGLEPQVGLAEYLTNRAEFGSIRDFVLPDRDTDLQLILGTRQSGMPTDRLFTSERFLDLLDVVRSRFEIVVADTAPVLPVIDAQYLAPHADIVLLGVRWANSSQREVRAAIESLRLSTGEPTPIGAILTQTEASASSYQTRYSGYYTDENG